MDDCAKGHVDAFVDGLCAENACCSDLVRELACLIEHEGQNVLVVRHRDDGL